ncbi:MAG: peptide chain release factor N(5)-glutamine methyltransferase [Pseudomonadota bacterium]
MIIDEALQQGAEALHKFSDTARLDCECLLIHCLNVQRSHLYAWPQQVLSDQQCNVFQQLLEKRLSGEPIAYIRGWQEFWSLRFEVGTGVLIPRPETELLVERVLSLDLGGAASVLDLGTGSGCIALSLAAERPSWQITAVDTSLDALRYAQRNLDQHGAGNVEILQSSWFTHLAERQFDLIVSNPPYVASDDQHLAQGDVRSEPVSALESGLKGLDDIRHIVENARCYLKQGGTLMLEHGFDQAESVAELLHIHAYSNIQHHKDLQAHNRVTAAVAI